MNSLADRSDAGGAVVLPGKPEVFMFGEVPEDFFPGLSLDRSTQAKIFTLFPQTSGQALGKHPVPRHG